MTATHWVDYHSGFIYDQENMAELAQTRQYLQYITHLHIKSGSNTVWPGKINRENVADV